MECDFPFLLTDFVWHFSRLSYYTRVVDLLFVGRSKELWHLVVKIRSYSFAGRHLFVTLTRIFHQIRLIRENALLHRGRLSCRLLFPNWSPSFLSFFHLLFGNDF